MSAVSAVDPNLLFESFLVFYMLECLMLVSVAIWYYYEPRVKPEKIWDPWGIWKGVK